MQMARSQRWGHWNFLRYDDFKRFCTLEGLPLCKTPPMVFSIWKSCPFYLNQFRFCLFSYAIDFLFNFCFFCFTILFLILFIFNWCLFLSLVNFLSSSIILNTKDVITINILATMLLKPSTKSYKIHCMYNNLTHSSNIWATSPVMWWDWPWIKLRNMHCLCIILSEGQKRQYNYLFTYNICSMKSGIMEMIKETSLQFHNQF